MKNPFEQHGIDHLSASQINMWMAQPSFWVATKLLGRKGSVGVAAYRGNAIEDGVNHGAFNPDAEIEQCLRKAHQTYSKLSAFSADPNKERERENIDPSVEIGVREIRKYGLPDKPDGVQHKVEISVEGVAVPIIGYLDWLFHDHGIIIDLKTTTRLPSAVGASHARQGAIYKRALNNYEMRFLYVTPKKSACLALHDAHDYMRQVEIAARSIQSFLAISNDAQELRAICPPPDPESFYWRGNETMRAEIFDY